MYLIKLGDADSMSVWDLLREFRIRQVHMAVVLNEYGGTVGVCYLRSFFLLYFVTLTFFSQMKWDPSVNFL